MGVSSSRDNFPGLLYFRREFLRRVSEDLCVDGASTDFAGEKSPVGPEWSVESSV